MSTALTRVAFSPGEGFGIVSWPTVALIELVDFELAERLWTGLVDGGDGNDLIDQLSVDGLRNLGSFVVAQIEGPDIRLFVRGSATVTYTGRHESGEIDGSSVRTWVERVVSGYRSVEIAINGLEERDGPYSVTSGLVPAGRLSWTVDVENSELMDPAVQPATSASVEELAAPTVRQKPTPGDPATSKQAPPEENPKTHTVAPSRPAEPDSSPETKEELDLAQSDVVDTGQTLHYESLDDEVERQTVVDSGSARIATSAVAVGSSPSAEAEEYDYDALFGRTTHRSVQGAAVASPDEHELDIVTEDVSGKSVAPQEPWQVGPSPAPMPLATGLISAIPSAQGSIPSAGSTDIDDDGDHDGLTMTVAQLRALRASGNASEVAPAPAAGGGPTVQALVCGVGHPNPTVLDSCRTCGSALSSAQVVILRPSLGRVRLSNGQAIELTRSAIVGRNPRVEGTMHGEVPSTVKIEGIQALSRSHAIIRLEGWQVMVEDLDSANGTTVTLQGRPPRRLRAGEPVILEHGAVIDFGGEVAGTYDAFA